MTKDLSSITEVFTIQFHMVHRDKEGITRDKAMQTKCKKSDKATQMNAAHQLYSQKSLIIMKIDKINSHGI